MVESKKIDRNAEHHEEVRIAVEDRVEETSERCRHVFVARDSPVEDIAEAGDKKAEGAREERPPQRDNQGRDERKKKSEYAERVRTDNPVSQKYPVNPQYERIERMAHFRADQ